MIRHLFAAALALCACAPPNTPAQAQSQAPAGSLFAANADRQWRLPEQLREISGLAVSADGRVFAHDDERAVIYELDTAEGRIIKAFSLSSGGAIETGDFEGLAITPAGDFWMVTSRGQLFRFREAADGAAAPFERFNTGLRNVCEIEGLAYLAAEESLIIACKRNEARDMRDTVSLHIWRIGAAEAAPWRSWPEAALAGAARVESFRPSSLDIDPATGRLLLLSARDGALAEIDGERIASARALGRAHIQAEGVAVLSDGSLAISDEGGDGLALLSVYPRSAQ